ncbi:hypothetical protein TNCV_837731 [Trichonephila clavipes]|nr:hypothetical protein TNCV_837731 [Trichonephila clavipes]
MLRSRPTQLLLTHITSTSSKENGGIIPEEDGFRAGHLPGAAFGWNVDQLKSDQVTVSKSDESGDRGLEFKTASISISKVINSSRVKFEFPATHVLKDLTPDSHKPPKFGDLGGMKFQSICSSLK